MPTKPIRLTTGPFTRLALGALLFGLAPGVEGQATGPNESIGSLKQLSLEQLMDIQVTSVSKEPEKLLDAAAAIQVVTNEEIERSGATSLPEALRLADNLEVAQENSHDWA